MDYGAQLKNYPELPDTYTGVTSSLTNLCNLAINNGQTLVITKPWTISTLNLGACPIRFVNGGKITYTGQLTLNGAISGDPTVHFVPSGSAPVPILNGQTGPLVPEWFGAVGDWNGSTGTDNCTPFNTLGGIGGLVFINHYYRISCLVTVTKPIRLMGFSMGPNVYTNAKGALIYDAGTPGIKLSLGTRGSVVEGLWIGSRDSSATSGDYGIEIGDSFITVRNNTFNKQGDDAIFCAASDPCDNGEIQDNIFLGVYGNGWHCSTTPDCNVNDFFHNSFNGVGGKGFYEESGADNTFRSNTFESVTGAAIDITGNSHTLTNNYCDGSFDINVRSTYTFVGNELGGGCNLKKQGGPSNTFRYLGQYYDCLGIGPFYGSTGAPASPTYYCMHSGSTGTGQLDLHDDTNNKAIFHYTPSTSIFAFDRDLQLLTSNIIQNGSTPVSIVKQDNSGSNTQNATLSLQGLDSTSVQAEYAQLSSFINANTHSATTGGYKLKIPITGTSTTMLTGFPSGSNNPPNNAAGLGISFGCTHGSNATCGVSTLSSGTVTVSTTAINNIATAGGAGLVVKFALLNCSNCGVISLGTVIGGTSFVINSSNGSDGSKVYWEIAYVN